MNGNRHPKKISKSDEITVRVPVPENLMRYSPLLISLVNIGIRNSLQAELDGVIKERLMGDPKEAPVGVLGNYE